MTNYHIAVFASGEGSNFQSLVDAARNGALDASVELLVCDKPAARVVQRAQEAGIDCHLFTPKSYASREAYEAEIIEVLESKQIDLVVLAGYMRLLTSVMVDRYAGRLINIHPSLLPAFAGKDAIGQALDYGVKVTGVTVHFVDGGMDTGPIIAQHPVPVMPGDTVETISKAIHAAEQQLYPEVVSWFAQGLVQLDGRHVTVNKPV
ncbi:Phosphoribosylglycinamide formyltransferase [Paenibacillus sp. JJ-100]|uniref:phosphoribosylglycinamide formyltransferase n=1 Tax=Paenibacillus sp. JJ-100 TaxID=2974896 RepID=UPI0022FF54C9|nr:phosphoribosylglycinamide formyltransferase [Paenibacillus sp. JJ-100]CAI6085387.1 Phosphoribosylglycinamide formyltransferase [Paenibacillus sp. JJ-100]